MNALSARAEWRWNARATSSLPVPLLARDEDGRAAGRRARDEIVHDLHLRTATDDLVEAMRARSQPVAQLPVLAHEPAALHGVAQDREHLVVLERLREVVERALLGRRDGIVDRPVRRDHHDRQLVIQTADLFQDFQAVLVRQHEIEQDGIELAVGQPVEAALGRGGRRHAIAFDDEQRFERFADDLLVVDDQDGYEAVCHESPTRRPLRWPPPAPRAAAEA